MVQRDSQLEGAVNLAAEEVLRVIYGDDLEGCAVSLDSIAEVIRAAFSQYAQHAADLAEINAKAFQAVELLATPPANGNTLSADDLRSLLGERLDNIRDLATKVLAATSGSSAESPEEEQNL